MAKTKTPLGPTGQTVAANVKRLRTDQKLTYAELSRRLESIGNPIPPLGLRRIEDGERKIDVDDLAALAVTLDSVPNYLLMPHSEERTSLAEFTGIGEVEAGALWGWLVHASPQLAALTGASKFDEEDASDETARQILENMTRTLPPWNMKEMLDELRRIGDEQQRRESHGNN